MRSLLLGPYTTQSTMASARPQVEPQNQTHASPAMATETEKANMERKVSSDHGGNTVVEQAATHAGHEVRPATNADHPKRWGLALLTVGICLVIFLISLESVLLPTCARQPVYSAASGRQTDQFVQLCPTASQ